MKGAQSRIKQQGRLKTRFRRPYFKQSRLFAAYALNLRSVAAAYFKGTFGGAAAGYGDDTAACGQANWFFNTHADCGCGKFLHVGSGIGRIV